MSFLSEGLALEDDRMEEDSRLVVEMKELTVFASEALRDRASSLRLSFLLLPAFIFHSKKKKSLSAFL